MKLGIVVRMEMLATHRWPNAPKRRKYLSYPHAHVFKFEGRADVSHPDRQIEFHDLRVALYNAVAMTAKHNEDTASFGEMSCEQIGEAVLAIIPELSSIVVSEDGQFDAIVTRETDASHIEYICPKVSETDASFVGGVRVRPTRVYLASASKGDRELLRKVAKLITDNGQAIVFAPCLAFVGIETPENRPVIIKVCLNTITEWAEQLYILDEGIPSEGCDQERVLAIQDGISTFFVRIGSEGLSFTEVE